MGPYKLFGGHETNLERLFKANNLSGWSVGAVKSWTDPLGVVGQDLGTLFPLPLMKLGQFSKDKTLAKPSKKPYSSYSRRIRIQLCFLKIDRQSSQNLEYRAWKQTSSDDIDPFQVHEASLQLLGDPSFVFFSLICLCFCRWQDVRQPGQSCDEVGCQPGVERVGQSEKLCLRRLNKFELPCPHSIWKFHPNLAGESKSKRS